MGWTLSTRVRYRYEFEISTARQTINRRFSYTGDVNTRARVSDCEWTHNTCRSFSWPETWPRRLWYGRRLLCILTCTSRIRLCYRSKNACSSCRHNRHLENTCQASSTELVCERSSRFFGTPSSDANRIFLFRVQSRQL